MTVQKLEKRLAALEQEVAALRTAMANGAHAKDWRRTIGMFSGDEVMKRIFDHALEYREKDRARARRRWAKKQAKT